MPVLVQWDKDTQVAMLGTMDPSILCLVPTPGPRSSELSLAEWL